MTERRSSVALIVVIADLIPGYEKFSEYEKAQLLSELWDELTKEDNEVAVDDPMYPLLDARMQEYRADASKGSPWTEVRERLRKSLK